jgi:HEAT repeat protein
MNPRSIIKLRALAQYLLVVFVTTFLFSPSFVILTRVESAGQGQVTQGSVTHIQVEIEKQQRRLGSPDVEERRDALTQLGSMNHPSAARAAVSALNDPLPIVRATAAAAILAMPTEESAGSLIPMLSDRDEFVRREVAYALGRTRSRTAVSPLVELLLNDKIDGVRGAAAVGLGGIADERAVASLSFVLDPQFGLPASKKSRRSRREQNPFVLRAAARALGQIGSRAGVPALITALQDEKADSDVRRESATALGMIADPATAPALRGQLTAPDAYLSAAINEALLRIQKSIPK